MPRGVYQRGPSRAKAKVIRTLRPGEPRPAGEPARYPDRDGYIRLRWRVGVREYVEIREHRGVLNAPAHEHVHHKNRVKDDNRPENLVRLSPSDHGHAHAGQRRVERGYGFDLLVAQELYAAGLSTPEIGRRLGVDASNVWRGLNRVGRLTRSLSEAALLRRLSLDEPTVLALHRSGVRAKAIAKQLGVSDSPIRRILRDHNEPSYPAGRPRVDRAS